MNLNDLMLTHTRGLTAQAALYLAQQIHQFNLGTPEARQECLKELRLRGFVAGIVQWADPIHLNLIKQHLDRMNIRMAWHFEATYPQKLRERMGGEAPAWVWVAGDAERLSASTCAMIGSRQSPPPFLSAARKLAAQLSGQGIVIASGGAQGADTAAHEGAREGKGGIVVVPARGVLTINLDDCQPNLDHMTGLCLDQAQAPFNAGRAIRRNDIIAALSDALVLVASEIKGGSAYAVRWALAHDIPVWCLVDGAMTPPGNEQLILQGLARPLSIDQPAEDLAQAVIESINRAKIKQAPSEEKTPDQMDIFNIQSA